MNTQKEWMSGLRRDGSIKGEPGICQWPGCSNVEVVAHFCSTHYAKARYRADLEDMLAPVYRAERCHADGCENPAYTSGWCRNHFAKVQRSGTPEGYKKTLADRWARPLNAHRIRCAMAVYQVTLEELGVASDVSREAIRQSINKSRLPWPAMWLFEERTGLPMSWFENSAQPRLVNEEVGDGDAA